MESFDYVIAGAGAAGCVLANRLSADLRIRVCLVEAGPRDTHPFIAMPKGLAKVMADPKHLWAYASQPDACTGGESETWVRGRVLGGSSSINGMMYVRGQPADFDALAELTSSDWSWAEIGPAYAALENHELGPGEMRGNSGPLRVSMPTIRDALSEAQIAAGEAIGLPRKVDVNCPDNGDGIGLTPRTIYKGKRQSAATAFLRPAESRPNLTVLTDATVDRVIFDGARARGVEIMQSGLRSMVPCHGEVILCGGAMASPAILERSGIGRPEVLAAIGVPLVHASPEVGENLIEHRGLIVQWKLRKDVSQNKQFKGWRLLRSVLQYYLTRTGPMSSAAYELGAWFRTMPGLNRPDAQMLIAPFSFDFAKNRQDVERFPGMHVVVYPLRPTSRGSIHATTGDPDTAATFQPNYRANEADRSAMINAVRMVRRWAEQPSLAELIEEETMPGPAFASDADILAAYDRFGTCGYHAVGSCRMGKDPASVVDPATRVRGVEALRIVDTSIMPIIPAGNTQGPTMAMAWRAADLILQDRLARAA
ncbi:GMC family oxidoreductase [Novosphingobium taihuense]|uniref:Choline dehydrogenase-like flavoprotein n=1 Tax=Novosphingobium taihuense TaxID=260085 RepID=A0A7W7A9R4_9SPHN|nr:GMC family oxidoreductase N-terminal domain-containing protein [Novosphingobium taihuense]MBB4613028.1 choline dehydrogenase-like flavoprotein [Novosphingobium taihuense]TWH85172.1 choline dehydrogenase-like flavoprotein [Novosphingobium taihuense]